MVNVMAHHYNYTDSNSHDQEPVLFQSLEFKGSRNRSLIMSVTVHGVLLTVLLVIPLIFTEVIKIRYDTVLIAPPPPRKQVLEVTPYREPPKPKPKPEKPLVVPPPVKPLVVKPPEVKPPEPKIPEPPKIAVKIPEPIAPPTPTRNTPHFDQPAPAPAAPKMEVKTGGFSTSEKPTTSLPAAKVQTGGFGDPDGIKGVGKPGKVANIAALGSFDLPAGPGAGNGTGGANGAKGTVASAGFGSGAASGSAAGSGSGGNRTVQKAGFTDVDAAKPDAPKKHIDTGPPQTPVEIQFKPKPDYTDEARKLKLQGEVLVRVLFTAGGEVRVLGVASGLGHGLDENAIRACQQIKFKPAERNGQPVDSTATVHIVFQLAY